MTTPIKTQCPHCHTPFNLPHAQLNQADTKARCGRCQHVFLVNEHLIVSANNQPELTDKAIKNKKTVLDKKLDKKRVNKSTTDHNSQPLRPSKETDSDDLGDDVLIHDDMEIDETPDAITEYGSLDEMDAWLSQLEGSHSNNANHVNSADDATSINKSNDTHTTESVSADSNADTRPNTNKAPTPPTIAPNSAPESSTHVDTVAAPAANSPQLPSIATVSSAAANNIHARVTATSGQNTDENAWLETLLKEQNDSDTSAVNNQDNTDLSQLLIDMGIAAADEEKINQARTSKIQARLQLSATSTQNSIATALWAAGCLVLMLLLLAQYVIFNLNTLVKNPAVATKLQAICSSAACSLPHADINAFTMTNLAHRPSRVQLAPVSIDIQADFVNASTQAQLLPSFKVSIYGSDDLIGEFIAQPKDYLLSNESQIAAESSKSVMFTVPIAANKISQLMIVPIY